MIEHPHAISQHPAPGAEPGPVLSRVALTTGLWHQCHCHHSHFTGGETERLIQPKVTQPSHHRAGFRRQQSEQEPRPYLLAALPPWSSPRVLTAREEPEAMAWPTSSPWPCGNTCLRLPGRVAVPHTLYSYPSDLQVEAPAGGRKGPSCLCPQAGAFVSSHGKTVPFPADLPSDRYSPPWAGQAVPHLGLGLPWWWLDPEKR